jgi:hypothetical protein
MSIIHQYGTVSTDLYSLTLVMVMVFSLVSLSG